MAEDATVAAPVPKKAFTFTDDGCRTEIRLGILLILAAVFVWLWLGPRWSAGLYFLGLPLVLLGVPLHARDARRAARPGYPLKLGLILTIGAILMWPDLLYREMVGGPLQVQPMAPLLLVAGLWILAWWPVARRSETRQEEQG